MNASLPLHASKPQRIFFLLPVLPVFFFFLHNISVFMERVLNKEVILLFVFYSLLPYLILLVTKLLFRFDLKLSAITAGLLTTSFLLFGTIQDFLLRFRISFLSNTYFLLLLMAGCCLIIILFIKKKTRRLKVIWQYFFLLFSLLILYESATILYKIIAGKSIKAITDRMITPLDLQADSSYTNRPDIYYIIFDGYTNATALKEYWQYDNEIYPYLASKGFYTVDSGFSNYKSTPFSISSVLNMQYLQGAEPYLLSNSSNFLIGQQAYKKNLLFKFLKQQGYEFSIYSQLEDEEMLTAFGFLGVEKPVNWLRKLTLERIYLDPWKLNKLKNLFSKKTDQQAVKLESMLKFDDYNKKALEHITTDCKKNMNGQLNKPVFAYTHFMIPHNPYLRDEDGNMLATPDPEGGNMAAYLQQVKYSNKLIRQLTECLLSDATHDKIIIFQGDHGFRHYTNVPESNQFLALNALYFYDGDYSQLKKNMSHVNTFRAVINNFFNGQMPFLEDRVFYLKKE